MRRTQLIVGCLVLALCSDAKAAGLLAGEGGQSGRALSAVSSVDIELELDDSSASTIERRSYVVGSSSFVAQPVAVVFHRSLLGAGDAEVTDATWDVGGGPVELPGEVLTALAADARRRELVAATGEPALLRELGAPMFVSEPVEVVEGQRLTIEFRLRAPLVSRGTLRGVSVPLDWHEQNVSSLEVDVHAETEAPLRAVYAPYHDLVVSRESDHRAGAHYEGRDVCSRFDVTVLASTGEEPLHVDLLPFRYGGEEGGYVLGLMTPSFDVPETALGRDLAIAIDVSGSMRGEKIQQAKQALSNVVSGLAARDTFSLISFSSVARALGSETSSATPSGKAAALAAIESLGAEGGTHLSGAIKKAFDALSEGGETAVRPRYVVLLTDGQPTEGVTDIEAIADLAEQLGEGGTRVFAFGIGADVNTLLLDRLAKDSGGRTVYVRDQTIEEAVSEFFSSIADPILTRPELDWEALGVDQAFPVTLPDIYAGRSTTFVARYSSPGDGELRVSGQAPNGAVDLRYQVHLPSYAFQDGSVARLWALRKVGALLEQLKIEGPDAALEREVFDLARRYGVVTDFTFFRLTEDGDMEFAYSDVPTDAVGATAVSTSASLSGYATSETTERAVDTTVRYFQDRNFPRQGGYATDATLARANDSTWTDLHFGSSLFYELITDEAGTWIHGFASIAPDVKFEHLGRRFRVTDPATDAADDLPTEATEIPAPNRVVELGEPVLARFLESESRQAVGDDGHPKLRREVSTYRAGCQTSGYALAGSPGGWLWILLVASCLGPLRRITTARTGSSSAPCS